MVSSLMVIVLRCDTDAAQPFAYTGQSRGRACIPWAGVALESSQKHYGWKRPPQSSGPTISAGPVLSAVGVCLLLSGK